ncbi:hypothetical protein ES288_D01G215000v1 [Gossypium darwinii]|uniref:Uncharacterized protein n=1 Tax=Gossypium darwinii TaxID=34276 RepID=A0A5D2DSD3_GOSDA|nr:hypothetical protein ES288_D01G215000v1 [Gossypium darwinii]
MRSCWSMCMKTLHNMMEYVQEETRLMNKGTRQDAFEGKLPTKAVKEEKTPFEEQIFGTKDWDVMCTSQIWLRMRPRLKINYLSKVNLKQSILKLSSLKKRRR